MAALTRRSSIKGTLAFMVSEALHELPRYDAKLDVFSYGNVIIAILTHQWPTPDLATRYEGEQLVALNEFQRREHHIISLSKDEKTHFCNYPELTGQQASPSSCKFRVSSHSEAY